MTKTVYFFTRGIAPTQDELDAIAKLKGFTEAPYDLKVFSRDASMDYLSGRYKPDYVSGSPPNNYADIQALDPSNIPTIVNSDTDTVVSNNQNLTVVDSLAQKPSDVTATVSESKLVRLMLGGDTSLFKNGDVLQTVDGGTVTFAIVGGKVTLTYAAKA